MSNHGTTSLYKILQNGKENLSICAVPPNLRLKTPCLVNKSFVVRKYDFCLLTWPCLSHVTVKHFHLTFSASRPHTQYQVWI